MMACMHADTVRQYWVPLGNEGGILLGRSNMQTHNSLL